MPHNNYLVNTRDIKFVIKEWLPMDKLLSLDAYKDYYGIDDIDNFLDVNYKICRDVICPTNKDADEIGCTYVGGNEHAVITPDSYKTMYKTVCEAELGPQFGYRGDGKIPLSWYAPILEMQSAASAAIVMFWCLTQGATTVLQEFGTEKQKEMFLPKMFTGEWGGTMGLTEPGAGSEVGACASKAYPTDTPHLYKLKGQKCFITSGDHDLAENIIHLMLAKTPDAKEGTAGISLFIVPKFWVNEDGSLEDNDVVTAGIEHKMGQYASCTAALVMGENGGCRGWLLGKNPLENEGKGEGMAQMFQMMNLARLETGHMAMCCIANAMYNAREYCKERIQGRPFINPRGDRITIINHEDIRRTLIMGKAHMEATRAMLMKALFNFDIREHDPSPEERQKAQTYVEIVTPLCKAYPSDEGWWLCAEAIQAYGGYGYCEEYPVAQIARDMKIYSIWEGTNFIQSLDLVGRKMGMENGKVFAGFIQEIRDFYEANKSTDELKKEFNNLGTALQAYDEIMQTLKDWRANNPALIPTYSRRVLTATSELHASHLLLDQALVALKKIKELGKDHHDYNFYTGKVMAARWFLRNVTPHIVYLSSVIVDGDTSVLEIPLESFDY